MPIAVCCQFLSLMVPHRRKAACEMLKNDTITKHEDKGLGASSILHSWCGFLFQLCFSTSKNVMNQILFMEWLQKNIILLI